MLTLFHHPLSPQSRYVRLILSEYGIPVRLVEERFWDRREEFLLLNPAGEVPVLVAEGQPAVPGSGGSSGTRQAGVPSPSRTSAAQSSVSDSATPVRIRLPVVATTIAST